MRNPYGLPRRTSLRTPSCWPHSSLHPSSVVIQSASMSDSESESDASTASWQRNRKLLLLLAVVLFIVMDVLMVFWFFRLSERASMPASGPGTPELTPGVPR